MSAVVVAPSARRPPTAAFWPVLASAGRGGESPSSGGVSAGRPRNAKAAATATVASLGGVRTIRPLEASTESSESSRSLAEVDEPSLSDMASRIDVREMCKDGFCSMSSMDVMAEAYAQLRDPALADRAAGGAGASMLGGLAVKSLDMGGLTSNVVARPSGRDTAGSVLSTPLHPDAARRAAARENRKAGRRRSAALMAEKEWWNCTQLFNMHEAHSAEEFHERVEEATSCGKTLVVDYFAPWCQACHRQYPDFVRFAATHPDLVFLKVNAANLRAFCEEQGVERLPSYAVYPPLYPEERSWTTSFFRKLTAQLDSEYPQ